MARRHEDEEEYEDEELPEGGGFVERLRDPSWRRALAVPLILLLFAAAGWAIWKKYEQEVLAHEVYLLDAERIEFTDAPDWLRDRDILAEVIQTGSLAARKIHESGLTVRVANAFEHHPWIKRVTRVRLRYPAKLEVEVEYREPVAMVALPDDDPNDEEVPRLPIDADAFLLPPEDFVHAESRELKPEFDERFPRIDVGGSGPAGDNGTSWGDPVVADAAKLAAVLLEDWPQLKGVLYQIERSSQPTTSSGTPDFDIRGRPDLGPTPPGLLIHWGRAPGRELSGEPTAETKLANLKQWINQTRLNGEKPLGVVDLRSKRAFQARQETGEMR